MSQSIASKVAAVTIAMVMNSAVLGGVCYLVDSHAANPPTSAHCQSDTSHLPKAIA